MSTKDSQQANYSYLATLAIQFIVNGSMDVSRAEWANINLTVGFQVTLSTSLRWYGEDLFQLTS